MWRDALRHCAQTTAAHRDLLVRDIAGYVALERGIAIDAGAMSPDLTGAP